MEPKIIYVSGAIGSIDREIATANFNVAELLLKTKGYAVINPMKITKPLNATWKDCMMADIKYLFDCDEIYMLRNWRNSTGARVELAIATELGLKVTFEDSRPYNSKFVALISEKERENFTLS